MSPWVVLLLVIGIAWLLHAQRMNLRLELGKKKIAALELSQKRLESRLSRHDRRLDVLFSAVNEAVMRVDRLGRVMAANNQASLLFRMNQAPTLPQSMLIFYRSPEWHREFSQALKGLPQAASLPDITVDERTFTPRMVPLGKQQALLLCLDVTEMKRLEIQRKTFLSNLMHDLKTPITSMLGYARSLEMFDDDPELRKESAKVIADESKYINELLNALLTLDRVDCFQPITGAHCVAADSIREAALLLHAELNKKELHIEWDITSELTDIAILKDDLHRIIINLLSNAIRFSPNNGNIHIGLTKVNNMCEISVTDEGDGVDEVELSRLTERFYRVDQARSRNGDGGHGLGLSIVLGLIKKYQGTLKLENSCKAGLQATVRLPFTR